MTALIADWERQSACLSSTEDLWYPDDDLPAAARRRMWSRAREVCVRCPVQVACLRAGLEHLQVGPVEGMYGGLEPAELRALARRLGRPARKVAAHGTRTCYVNNRCRQPECVAANARYEAERRKRIA